MSEPVIRELLAVRLRQIADGKLPFDDYAKGKLHAAAEALIRPEEDAILPGLRAAMRAIENHRDTYAQENGSVDPTTNAYEARQAVTDRLEALDDAIEIINKLAKKAG